MSREMGPMSGFRDFLPSVAIPRKELISTIESVYTSYGFVPLETPALERRETLLGKYGSEANKLIYKFQDPGGTLVALRFDLTVPLARVVAQYPDLLPMPFKRYQVGSVWRGERPQAGRYREFIQLDADTVGVKGVMSDAEIVLMMADTMEALGVSSTIRVNNRRLLDALVEECGIDDPERMLTFVRIIDKREKIGEEAALEEIRLQFGDNVADFAGRFISLQGSNEERLQATEKLFKSRTLALEEGIENLTGVFSIVEAAGSRGQRVVFDPSIARGLDYYTGIIFETSLDDLPEIGSVFSGGRYDKLIVALGGPDLPAVGASVGVDRLIVGLQKVGVFKEAVTSTEVMMTSFSEKDIPIYMQIATTLRRAGISTEVYLDASRRIGKQLSMANKLNIPYVVIAGPDELQKNMVLVRDMWSGEETKIAISQLVDFMQSLQSFHE